MECGGWAPARRGKARKRILFVVLGLAVVVSSVLLYRYFASWEFTDDAEIDGYIYPVSSRLSGYVQDPQHLLRKGISVEPNVKVG